MNVIIQTTVEISFHPLTDVYALKFSLSHSAERYSLFSGGNFLTNTISGNHFYN